QRESGDDGRGARPEPARDRDRGVDVERDRGCRLARRAAQTAERPEHHVPMRIDREIASFAPPRDPEAGIDARGGHGERKAERKAEAIEAGSQVRGRRGRDGAPSDHSRINFRRRDGSPFTVSTFVEIATARSGSLSPCPVTVATARPTPFSSPFAPSLRSPAMPAADAGSTKTPSVSARSRYAARISSSLTIPI